MTSPFGSMTINSFAQWHSEPEIPHSHPEGWAPGNSPSIQEEADCYAGFA